jgi:hypothetical protein
MNKKTMTKKKYTYLIEVNTIYSGTKTVEAETEKADALMKKEETFPTELE